MRSWIATSYLVGEIVTIPLTGWVSLNSLFSLRPVFGVLLLVGAALVWLSNARAVASAAIIACDVQYMRQTQSETDFEKFYSPKLQAAFEFILDHPAIYESPESRSSKFIMAARFLKANAPHFFQVRHIGIESEDLRDRWLWEFLDGLNTPVDVSSAQWNT
jgi:hypothetical protein